MIESRNPEELVRV